MADDSFNLDDGSLASRWRLDPAVTFLNHGSFGACPVVVREAQKRYQDELEAEPVRFLTRTAHPLMERSRQALAQLLRADAGDIAFVSNATGGVNSVVRSLRFEPGDELLTTDHAYNACRNVLDFVAQRAGLKLAIAALPFPLQSPDEIVEAIARQITPRTRLAMIDHVTSATGLVLPVERIIPLLAARGIEVLIDGAHAPGMVDIDLARLAELGCTYYTGNCHKWLCAPKGAAFLFVRHDRQHLIAPAIISHGWNTARPDRSRFQTLFDWTGTQDVTPLLCIADAIAFVESLLPGGLPALMRRNRELALTGRRTLLDALAPLIEGDAHMAGDPAPAEMIGSLAAVPLPDDPDPQHSRDWSTWPTPTHTLQVALMERGRFEVPAYHWPRPPKRLIRISAAAYNHLQQYRDLAACLMECLAPL